MWFQRILAVLAVFTVNSLLVTLITDSQSEYNFNFATYDSLFVPNDKDAIEQGRQLFVTRGCVDCHGDDTSGSVVQEGWIAGRIEAPNLTSGVGGFGTKRTGLDFVRVIHEGVKPTRLLFFLSLPIRFHRIIITI